MYRANPKIDLVFKKIFGTEQNKGVDRMSFNEKERDYYDSKQKVMRDEMAVLQTVYEKGKDQAMIDVAKLLKDLGKITIAEIMKVTGLTKEQIENL